MITGIKLQLSSKDLATLAESRAAYHAEKAEFLITKAKEIAPALEDFDVEAEESAKYMSGGRNDDPARSLVSKSAHHRNRAIYFRFVAKNVIPNETYIIDENDLTKLEVLSAW